MKNLLQMTNEEFEESLKEFSESHSNEEIIDIFKGYILEEFTSYCPSKDLFSYVNDILRELIAKRFTKEIKKLEFDEKRINYEKHFNYNDNSQKNEYEFDNLDDCWRCVA